MELALTVRGVGDVRNAHLDFAVPLEEHSLVRPDAVRPPVVKQPLNQRRLVGAEGAGADPAPVAAERCAADQAVGEFAEHGVHAVAALVLRVLSDSGVGGRRLPLPLPAACRERIRRVAAVPWLALRVRAPLAGLQLLHQLDVGGNRNQQPRRCRRRPPLPVPTIIAELKERNPNVSLGDVRATHPAARCVARPFIASSKCLAAAPPDDWR